MKLQITRNSIGLLAVGLVMLASVSCKKMLDVEPKSQVDQTRHTVMYMMRMRP